jgi:hypothetical protein
MVLSGPVAAPCSRRPWRRLALDEEDQNVETHSGVAHEELLAGGIEWFMPEILVTMGACR